MKKHFLLVFVFIFLSSCSLEYEKEENPENTTPEFTFTNANFSRVEKDKKKMLIVAEKIEQYKTDSTSFAKNVKFNTFNDEEKDEIEGNCNFIFVNTINERYMLFGNIEMNMISQNMKIKAESLNFDKKNEQITSEINQKVTIRRNDIEISGIGFSASGVSKKFAFLKEVSGEIETENGKK